MGRNKKRVKGHRIIHKWKSQGSTILPDRLSMRRRSHWIIMWKRSRATKKFQSMDNERVHSLGCLELWEPVAVARMTMVGNCQMPR